VGQLRAQLVDGSQAQLAELIAPGETLKVDVPVFPVKMGVAGPGIGPLASREDRVMFATASRSFTALDQLALVGLGPASAKASGTKAPLTVTVQTSPFEQAQSSTFHQPEQATAGTRDIYPSRLSRTVSTFHAPSGEWVSVYDMAFRPPDQPAWLTYSPTVRPPPFEVYNGISNTWRPLPLDKETTKDGASDSRTVRLLPGEGERNVVRVRARGTMPAAAQITLLLDGPAQG